MPMLTAGVTLDTLPALACIAAVIMTIISAGLFVMNLWQRKENDHLHGELYAWKKFGDSIEFVDDTTKPAPAPAPVRKKAPRPIPEGLEVIHPAVAK